MDHDHSWEANSRSANKKIRFYGISAFETVQITLKTVLLAYEMNHISIDY
jgi:hypothetical protein